MKKHSLSKLLLGGIFTLAAACNTQQTQSCKTPSQDQQEQEDREDGDMCAVPEEKKAEGQVSSKEASSSPAEEKTVSSPEVKAVPPVVSEAPRPAKSEERSSVAEVSVPEKAKVPSEGSVSL